VSRLRACLCPAGHKQYGVRLETRGGGYLVRVDPGSLDLHRFERLTEEDVMSAAREQGIGDLTEVQVGILEADGKFSFLHASGRRPPVVQEPPA
jgi:hypothetical protein